MLNNFGPLLLGNRIEFTFIGHADHRGKAELNQRLSKRRSETVKSVVDRAFQAYGTYSSWDAVSKGEAEATQGRNVDLAVMARERRVDVYTSLDSLRLPPIVSNIPLVKRVVYRKFGGDMRCTNSANVARPGGVQRQEFKKLLRCLINSVAPDSGGCLIGLEKKNRRRHKMIPATHGVNAVYIEKDSDWSMHGPAECEQWGMTVEYEWGSPKPQVKIEMSETNVVQGKVLRRSKKTVHKPRKEIMNDEMFFPKTN